MSHGPFIALIDKSVRPRAWYALGVNVVARYYMLVGSAVASLFIMDSFGGNPTTAAGWQAGPMMATAFLAFLLPDRVLRWYRARWVDKLELPLDRETYAAALDGGLMYARLEIVVEGESLQCPEINGIVAHLTASSPTRLVFESFTMQLRRPRVKATAHNLELHLWFVLLTERILRPIARTQRIDRITARYLEASHPAVTTARAVQR